jgi:hypothetical protein
MLLYDALHVSPSHVAYIDPKVSDEQERLHDCYGREADTSETLGVACLVCSAR